MKGNLLFGWDDDDTTIVLQIVLDLAVPATSCIPDVITAMG